MITDIYCYAVINSLLHIVMLSAVLLRSSKAHLNVKDKYAAGITLYWRLTDTAYILLHPMIMIHVHLTLTTPTYIQHAVCDPDQGSDEWGHMPKYVSQEIVAKKQQP